MDHNVELSFDRLDAFERNDDGAAQPKLELTENVAAIEYTTDMERNDNNFSALPASVNLHEILPESADGVGENTVADKAVAIQSISSVAARPRNRKSGNTDLKDGFFYSGNPTIRHAAAKRTNVTSLAAAVHGMPVHHVAATSKALSGDAALRSLKKKLERATDVQSKRTQLTEDSSLYDVMDELPTVSVDIGESMEDELDEPGDDSNTPKSDDDNRDEDADGRSDDLSISYQRKAATKRGVKRKFAGLPLREKQLSKLSVMGMSRGTNLPDDYTKRTRIERRRAVVQYYCGDGNRDAAATVAHFRERKWPYRTVRNFLNHYDKTGTIQRKQRIDGHNYDEMGDKVLELFIARGDKYSAKEAMAELGINKNAYWRVCEKHEGFKKALGERNLEAELVNEAKRSVVIEKFLAAEGDYRERRNACVRYFWKIPGFYQTFIFESVDRFIRCGTIRSIGRMKQSTWSSADAHGALLRLVPGEERYMLKLQATQAEMRSLLNGKTGDRRRKTIAGIDVAGNREQALMERNAHLEKLLAKSETDRLAALEEAAALRAEIDRWKLWAASTTVVGATNHVLSSVAVDPQQRQ